MTRRSGPTAAVVLILLAMTVAACRQPEGRMPVPEGDEPNRIEDVARDLQHVAGGSTGTGGPMDFFDDLATLGPEEAPEDPLSSFGDALVAALPRKDLSDANAKAIANVIFVAVVARDLNPAQIGRVEADVTQALTAAGAPPEAAQRAGAAAAALQRAVTTNKKRWYYLF